jgi:hypothetical protein
MEAHSRVHFLDAERKPVVFITVQISSLNVQQGQSIFVVPPSNRPRSADSNRLPTCLGH